MVSQWEHKYIPGLGNKKVRLITPEEHDASYDKNLCLICSKSWSPNHYCPQSPWIHMIYVKMDDNSYEDSNGGRVEIYPLDEMDKLSEEFQENVVYGELTSLTEIETEELHNVVEETIDVDARISSINSSLSIRIDEDMAKTLVEIENKNGSGMAKLENQWKDEAFYVQTYEENEGISSNVETLQSDYNTDDFGSSFNNNTSMISVQTNDESKGCDRQLLREVISLNQFPLLEESANCHSQDANGYDGGMAIGLNEQSLFRIGNRMENWLMQELLVVNDLVKLQEDIKHLDLGMYKILGRIICIIWNWYYKSYDANNTALPPQWITTWILTVPEQEHIWLQVQQQMVMRELIYVITFEEFFHENKEARMPTIDIDASIDELSIQLENDESTRIIVDVALEKVIAILLQVFHDLEMKLRREFPKNGSKNDYFDDQWEETKLISHPDLMMYSDLVGSELSDLRLEHLANVQKFALQKWLEEYKDKFEDHLHNSENTLVVEYKLSPFFQARMDHAIAKTKTNSSKFEGKNHELVEDLKNKLEDVKRDVTMYKEKNNYSEVQLDIYKKVSEDQDKVIEDAHVSKNKVTAMRENYEGAEPQIFISDEALDLEHSSMKKSKCQKFQEMELLVEGDKVEDVFISLTDQDRLPPCYIIRNYGVCNIIFQLNGEFHIMEDDKGNLYHFEFMLEKLYEVNGLKVIEVAIEEANMVHQPEIPYKPVEENINLISMLSRFSSILQHIYSMYSSVPFQGYEKIGDAKFNYVSFRVYNDQWFCQGMHKIIEKLTFIIWSWYYKEVMKGRNMTHPGKWIAEWRIAWI